ncbi:MAG: hypothetical protein HZB80_03595 [Deltaproteobacteria bacterium]|nr:hypothetical protein [Deltaproteobacteria bacterium]
MEKRWLDDLIDMMMNENKLQTDNEKNNEVNSTWVVPQEREIDIMSQY